MKNSIHTAVGMALAAATLVSGCAALRAVATDVSTFGTWPAERRPGSYAFDRLPSQQADAANQQVIENAAAQALAHAGFSVVAAGAAPDVLVQVGATVSRISRTPWDDPFWGRGGFGAWHGGPWHGRWGLSMGYESPRYDREVAVLLRDRASGAPLYEAHASSDGGFSADQGLITAMYRAALSDFPKGGPNPRRVTVQRDD